MDEIKSHRFHIPNYIPSMKKIITMRYDSVRREITLFGHLLSQQNLQGSYPLFSSQIVLPITILIGFLCITLGCVLHAANSNVLFQSIEYGGCTGKTCEIDFALKDPWEGKIYFYYRLRHFYKTHRRIQRNVCREQLIGLHPRLFQSAHVSNSFYSTTVGNKILFYAPMGVNAAAMFNDVFTLKFLDTEEIVPFTTNGITTDEEERYYSYYAAELDPNQSWCNHEIFKDTVKPKRWKKHICEMGGYKNKDFIVWMRPVINNNFKKLHRILNNVGTFANGLPAGKYRLIVENNYNISFHHLTGKAFEILRPSWYGNKNHFLFVCYMVIGTVYIVIGIAMTVKHLMKS